MIVDRDTAMEMTREDWSSLPDRKTGVVRTERNGELGITLTFHKWPEPQKDDAMVNISHAVTVTDDDGRFIFCAQLESIDLRLLAGALGVSVTPASHSGRPPPHTEKHPDRFCGPAGCDFLFV